MKNILLISPDFNPADTKARYVHFKNSGFFDLPITPAKAFMAPLSLYTLAALTPENYNVDIWDEAIQGTITSETEFEKNYDLVGVTGYVSHTSRMRELGDLFREKGILTACGGPDVSGSPEHYRSNFDILFVGEAEYTWPQFLAEWESGHYRTEYRQVDRPLTLMLDSPVPSWDKLVPYIQDYSVAAIQTTRGCPFDCHYCDVVYIYGREPRHKRTEQVVEEVRVLERLGARVIFLCDDNFIGTPNYTRQLLEALIQLNKKFSRPIAFQTQITLNVTDEQNEDILEKLAYANFTNLFIGVESPSEEALREANKFHNLHGDIEKSIKKIHSYGMIVQPGMIVGFDDDDHTIFNRHIQFIQRTGMWNPMENTLKAPLGTKLWTKMQQAGRIVKPLNVENYEEQIGSDLLTNIIPAKLTREELMTGYRDMVIPIRNPGMFEERGKTMLMQVYQRPEHLKEGQLSWGELKMQIPFYARLLLSMDMEKRPGRMILNILFRALRKSPPVVTTKLLGHVVRQYLASTNTLESRAQKQAADFIPFLLSLDLKTGLAFLRLLLFTIKHRPYMLEQVLGQIGRQYMLHAQLPDLIKAVDQQVSMERQFGVEIEPKVFFIPQEFRKIYPGIFPALYDRTRKGLTDKTQTLNILAEATYDFLTRWGENFKEFDRQLHVYFNEICDRAIADENRHLRTEPYITITAEDSLDPQLIGLAPGQVGVRLRQWSSDVLHSVEQRMRSFKP